MQTENRVGLRIFQRAFLDHQRRTAFFTARRAFFGRLKNEFDRARQSVFGFGKHFGNAHQDRDVGIMPASMHHADFLAFVFAFGFRGERQIDHFDDRQRIHVGAQRDDGAGLAAFQQGNDAGLPDAGT